MEVQARFQDQIIVGSLKREGSNKYKKNAKRREMEPTQRSAGAS